MWRSLRAATMRGSWIQKCRWGCSCATARGSSYGIESWQGNSAVRPVVLRRLSGLDAVLDTASTGLLWMASPLNSNASCNVLYSAHGSAPYRAFQESWAITRLPGFAPTRAKLQTRTPTLLTMPDSVLVWHVIPFLFSVFVFEVCETKAAWWLVFIGYVSASLEPRT